MKKAITKTRSRAVKHQKSPQTGMFLKSVVILMVLIASALFYVWSHVQIVSEGYKLSEAKVKEAELKKTNEKLRLEVLRLMNPSRLEKIAHNDLGLILPGPNRIIYIKGEK